MHIVFLNYVYDDSLRTISELLDRYYVIPDWCNAVLNAGAGRVTVVQRFKEQTRLEREGVEYIFMRDSLGATPHWWQDPSAVHNLVARLSPDIVHLNGLTYFADSLRKVLAPEVPIVWQSHANGTPKWFMQWYWKKNFQFIDGVLFTSAEQAQPLQARNILKSEQKIYEVPEASSSFKPLSYEASREKLGIKNQPVFLWVGRLVANKDPLTVLRGFHHVVKIRPNAHLYMVFNKSNILDNVRATISTLSLQNNVSIVGKVEHSELPQYYSAADFFVLGSHQEVCGFAFMEAISCGAYPIVTDIPSFRKITRDGKIGVLWKVGNPSSFAEAVSKALERNVSREAVLTFFKKNLSYDVLGQQALSHYKSACENRRQQRFQPNFSRSLS